MTTIDILIIFALAFGAGYFTGRSHSCFRVAEGKRP